MRSQHDIRQKMRKKRNALKPEYVQTYSQSICNLLLTHSDFPSWQNIGIYLAIKHEINLLHFIQTCWQSNKTLYAPKIKKHHQSLDFFSFKKNDRLIKNQYGIDEPTTGENKAACDLDVLIMPLIAFDSASNRIGMGAGYYDRTLKHKKVEPSAKPYLIGVAYPFQAVKAITKQTWDIPLNEIITSQY